MSKKEAPPPEPIPQSTIVALQAWQDKHKISNANWENKLNQAVTVNPADSIFVKASFIDTRGTASGNIDLSVDTEISLEYYFYWSNTFNACDPSGLIQSPATPDASNNLNQQVLVGGPITYLIGASSVANNVPAYYTSHTNGGPFTATGINDADGLPYLVMQSTNDFPVPPVIGNEEDAIDIVVGNIYLVAIVGLTINWAYAGVTGANYNKLPAGWDLNTSYFTATHNPWYNLPTSAFIPAALAAPLPYITYIITNVGATDWVAIDPGLASNIIPATQMVNGGRYSIVTLGNLDYTFYGAGQNTVGDVFTATVNPPALPPIFPITITNEQFFDNGAQWYTYGTYPNGDYGPEFGQDNNDYFQVTIDMDDTTGIMTFSNLSGFGGWLNPTLTGNFWTIPASFFGFNAGTPSATDVVLSAFTSTQSGLSVTLLTANSLSYTPLNTGVLDGSVPQFTWDMVCNTFPKTTTANMVVGTSYQVVAPQTSTLIFPCDNFGQISEIFTATQTSISGASQNYTGSTLANDCSLKNEQGTEFIPYLQANYEANIIISENNITGLYDYFPSPSSILGSGPHEGSPFSELPEGNPYASTILTLVIQPNIQSNTTNPITFTSYLITEANPTPNGAFDEGNVYTMSTNDSYPAPQNLIAFDPTQSFVATAAYTGTGTTATVIGYTMTGMTLTGTGYINGTVESSVVEVGTIVHAINPDPDLPTDNGGTANVSPFQAGSTLPFQYDGYVKSYVPPTTRQEIRPVKKRWSMTIPKGSYNPNYLAELISRNMSRQKIKRVNNVQGTPLGGPQSTLTVPTDSVYSNVPAPPVWASPTSGGANTFFDSKNPAVYGFPPALDYNLPPDNADDMPFLFCPAMNSSLLNNNPIDASNNYIYAEIPHPNANGLNNLPVPTWYVNLVPLCNDVLSVSPTLNTINVNYFDNYYSILPFYSQNSLFSDGTSSGGNSGIFPIVFGATQTSLLYNNENNGIFSFNYLHSPIYANLSSNSTDLVEATAHMYTTQKSSTNMAGTNFFTTLIDKKSGILLNKMEPASFWNQLGFDIAALTVDLDQDPNGYGYYMSFREFQSKTTGGFSGSANIFNPIFKTANSADQPCVPDTELVFLTAIPNTPSPGSVIEAYTPNLTVGTEYVIYKAGEMNTGGGTREHCFDWTSIGGPNVGAGNDPTGLNFVATATGFNSNQPPPPGLGWLTPPLVIPLGTSISTNSQLQNTYFQVENTNVLNATSIPTVRDATGHYLVEITGYNSNYIDDKNKREIKAIVSSYWVSPGAFVSVPFPDSYNFYGTGAPLTISALKIRILDPFTNSEAVIGPNSSIYLQINKMLTDQAVAQIPN